MRTGEGKKVLVAMSGGVDSSVAAALLVRAGYEVVGCFMRLGSLEEEEGLREQPEGVCTGGTPVPPGQGARAKHKGCCSVGDAADARLVAAELGIPFYVCNFRKDFGRIIDYFVDEYLDGRTPNPCVRCNDWLKFGKLHAYAKQIGADYVASGHYACVRRHGGTEARGHGGLPSDGATGRRSDEGGAEAGLFRGVDREKDQSYVLFGAPRSRLSEMLLPIGAFEKRRVRAMAEEFGLPVFDKPDSQEICFVPDDDYAGLVERHGGTKARGHGDLGSDGATGRRSDGGGGAILDAAGNVVGAHGGQHRFTVGQRRGVGVALGRPVYVVEKDARANTVTVGPREMLLVASLEARETNWLVDAAEWADWRPVRAQFRAHGEAAPAECRLSPSSDTLEVRFEAPQTAVAAGQAIVCYDAETNRRVLGGGWIRSTRRAGERA